MSSASTKRRHQRNAELVAAWRNIPIGQRVTVRRENGEVLKTVTESRAELVNGKHAMIRVDGIPGNTRLDRVRMGWNPAPVSDLASEVMREMMKPPGQEDYDAAFRRARSTGSKDAEIQRLRAAMVHAMDAAEMAGRSPMAGLWQRSACQSIVRILKTALEKK